MKNHSKHFTIPIPEQTDIKGWETVTIRECDEELVTMDGNSDKGIVIDPQYYKFRLNGALDICYARKTVLSLLIEASKHLPSGYKFKIWDAWRPLSVQSSLFESYTQKIKLSNKELSEKSINDMAKKYVSKPSINDKKPYPHSTGGAIDLTIIDSNGNDLEMGTGFDDFSKTASTAYYENKPGELSQIEIKYRDNRRLLYNILTDAEFTNFPNEWWHFDYGNQFWGRRKQKDAFYGFVNEDYICRMVK